MCDEVFVTYYVTRKDLVTPPRYTNNQNVTRPPVTRRVPPVIRRMEKTSSHFILWVTSGVVVFL